MNRKFSLRKNNDIGAVVRAKQSVGNRYYAIYYKKNTENKTQVAVSVSKKLGNAVARNYEKRVIREIIRELIPLLPNLSVVIVIKKNAEALTFVQKQEQIKKLISNIKRTGERNDK